MAWGWGGVVTVPNYPPSQTRVRGTGLGRTGANSYRKKGRGPPGVGEGAPSSGSGSETWTCHPQRGGCCPRTDELALSPDPGLWDAWGTGQEGETGSAALLPARTLPLPLPWLLHHLPDSLYWAECLSSPPPFSLQSHIKCHLIPSLLHSLVHFIQSDHGEASLGPEFQGTPQGTHSLAGEVHSYKHTHWRQSNEL